MGLGQGSTGKVGTGRYGLRQYRLGWGGWGRREIDLCELGIGTGWVGTGNRMGWDGTG